MAKFTLGKHGKDLAKEEGRDYIISKLKGGGLGAVSTRHVPDIEHLKKENSIPANISAIKHQPANDPNRKPMTRAENKLTSGMTAEQKAAREKEAGERMGGPGYKRVSTGLTDTEKTSLRHAQRSGGDPNRSEMKSSDFTLKAYQAAKREGGVPAVKALSLKHAEWKREQKKAGGDPYGEKTDAYRAEQRAAHGGDPNRKPMTRAENKLTSGMTAEQKAAREKEAGERMGGPGYKRVSTGLTDTEKTSLRHAQRSGGGGQDQKRVPAGESTGGRWTK